jgi:Ser/Thr protein kinase RdoA (MazF antagonist)
MDDLLYIARQFSASVAQITLLGNGLINDTYRVTTDASCFVLQRINHRVFNHPEQIMANLTVLNQHVRQKSIADVKLQVPDILLTNTGSILYTDAEQDCWRAIKYIENSESIEAIRHIADAEQIGFALGHFHYLLSDLNPALLQDTLPGFHIAPAYFDHYQQISQQTAVKADAYCAAFIADYASIVHDLEDAKQHGLLTMRVTHGDPKINNFLFDSHSQHIISLIDLDTVKPGLVHYDIGDCLRSCCHDEDNNQFNVEIAAAILKTYLVETASFFTEYDYAFLYPAIRLIPFELGIRFYTDYLQDNRYFKVTDAEQNLRRAIAQFRLCASVMVQEKAIRSLITQAQL